MSSGFRYSGLVEFFGHAFPRRAISHVLFDFDGTLSIIRQGWPEVMVPMFLEMLPRSNDDTAESLHTLLLDDIMSLNGKQTIYQMIRFAERVKERGGVPQEPLWYKHEYLRRLEKKISARKEALRSGKKKAEDYTVFGSLPLLKALEERGLAIYLASGTDEKFVKEEAGLLGLTHYFGAHIYGAQDDFKNFSKKMVIDRILAGNDIDGVHLLAFGDGYVEIQNTKEVGGLAVAVASDEGNNGSGQMDLWKRNRLVGVGADVAIPDYRDVQPLLEDIIA